MSIWRGIGLERTKGIGKEKKGSNRESSGIFVAQQCWGRLALLQGKLEAANIGEDEGCQKLTEEKVLSTARGVIAV